MLSKGGLFGIISLIAGMAMAQSNDVVDATEINTNSAKIEIKESKKDKKDKEETTVAQNKKSNVEKIEVRTSTRSLS